MTLSHHPDYVPDWSGCDGCGSGWNEPIVPDTIYGLSIRQACCIHDHRYTIGGYEADKENADKEFLSNMLTLIDNNKKWYYPTWLARRRAMTYYDAVIRAGEGSFNYHHEGNTHA